MVRGALKGSKLRQPDDNVWQRLTFDRQVVERALDDFASGTPDSVPFASLASQKAAQVVKTADWEKASGQLIVSAIDEWVALHDAIRNSTGFLGLSGRASRTLYVQALWRCAESVGVEPREPVTRAASIWALGPCAANELWRRWPSEHDAGERGQHVGLWFACLTFVDSEASEEFTDAVLDQIRGLSVGSAWRERGDRWARIRRRADGAGTTVNHELNVAAFEEFGRRDPLTTFAEAIDGKLDFGPRRTVDRLTNSTRRKKSDEIEVNIHFVDDEGEERTEDEIKRQSLWKDHLQPALAALEAELAGLPANSRRVLNLRKRIAAARQERARLERAAKHAATSRNALLARQSPLDHLLRNEEILAARKKIAILASGDPQVLGTMTALDRTETEKSAASRLKIKPVTLRKRKAKWKGRLEMVKVK